MSHLRKIFGPSRDEIWQQLANNIRATYVNGDFWNHGHVQASHAGWQITLEKHGKHHARMRAPFVNTGEFRFNIYRKGVFTELGKSLGMQDVEVGHLEFDRDFVIQGTDALKLQQIFGNARIRELITAQPRVHFETKDARDIVERFIDDKPYEGLEVLEFSIDSSGEDETHLRLLFDLFTETLDELCRMGVAKTPQST